MINSDKEGYISIPFLTERSARSHPDQLVVIEPRGEDQ